MNTLVQLATLASATSAISITITKGGVFSKQRQWIKGRNSWLGKLVSCPYCLSHWVAAALVAIYQPTPLSAWLPVDLAISVFITVAIAAVISGVILWLMPFSETEREEMESLYKALREARKLISEVKEK